MAAKKNALSTLPAQVAGVARKAVKAVRRRFAQGGGSGAATPDPKWVAELRSFRWLSDDEFELSGWAYDRSVDYTDHQPRITVWAEGPGRTARIPLTVIGTPSPEVDQSFNVPAAEEPKTVATGTGGRRTTWVPPARTNSADHSRTVFTAVGSLGELAQRSRGARNWRIRIGVAAAGSDAEGSFLKRYGLGPAAYLTSRRVDGHTATPRWSRESGLTLALTPLQPTVSQVTFHPAERTFSLHVAHSGRLDGARLVSGSSDQPLAVIAGPEGSVLTGHLPLPADGTPWRPATPTIWDPAPAPAGEEDLALPYVQHRILVQWRGEETPLLLGSADVPNSGGLPLEVGPAGEVRLVSSTVFAVIDAATLIGDDEPALQVSGRCWGDLTGARLVLASERDVRSAPLGQSGETFRAVIPFLESKWGQPPLPPQIGRFPLRGFTADGRQFALRCAPGVIDLAPDSVWNRWFRLYFAVNSGKELAPRLDIPLTDDEIGTYHQERIRRFYEGGGYALRDAAYFESFYGRITGCNPLALNDEMAAAHPQVPRYWAVRDLSVAVPEGATAVVDGSEAWWRARGECRWVIVNDWLRARFQHQEGQTVLQTWHGTMYKKVGLDRGEQLSEEEREFMLGERRKWDLLLSQNPHSTRVFRESYASNPPIYEEGYPRNDLLINGDGAVIRERLGIGADKIVVLYAPTWRDDRTDLVDYLDVNKLARDLGDRYVVLLRAHSRVIRVGRAVRLDPGVLDVSTYPSATDMMLISDIMITDYSSMMFDYAVTRRPMIFFTPDLGEYRDQLRGVYLDLEKVGPGPMISTQDSLLDTIRNIDRVAPEYAERYAQWCADYTPWDDGQSGRRVLTRYLQDAPPADPGIL